MQQRAAAIADGVADEVIWGCEHDPVYTTGRRGVDNRTGAALPAPLLQVDRGGETTFHGPGQLLLYPVVDLRRYGVGVRDYVTMLEQSCINLLATMDIDSGRRSGFPGVWIGSGKVAALGVRVTRGVAFHGMALNLAVEAGWFAAINPCGLSMAAVNVDAYAPVPAMEIVAGEWRDSFLGLLARA